MPGSCETMPSQVQVTSATTEQFAEESPSNVPDGGYGWVIVACIGATNAVTWGEYAIRHYITI